MKIIQATLDHRVCGAGRRVFVLVRQGPKHLTLFELNHMAEFKIPAAKVLNVEDLELSERRRRRMARRLEERQRNFRRWGRTKWAKKTARRIIDELRGAPLTSG